MGTTPTTLTGRNGELDYIARLIEKVLTGAGGALALRGEPGIGKSELLAAGERLADGMRVLDTCGFEAESTLAYATLHRLLRPVLDQMTTLPAPQAEALSSALGLSADTSADPFLIALATLTLLSEAAIEQPLLCLIDDLQWADIPSARVLAFVARRLEAEPIALLFAVRDGEGNATDLSGVRELRLTGLPADAAAALFDSHASGSLPPGTRERLLRLSRGNPLALIELSASGAAAVGSTADSGNEPPQLSEELEGMFLAWAHRTEPAEQTLLLLAAAEGIGRLHTVRRAAELMGVDPAALESERLAGLVKARDQKIDFRHPLVRSAVYHGASPGARREAHQALADALGGADADRSVWHRARATPGNNESVAAELELTAGRTLLRSGHLAAAATLVRAADLSPQDADRARRLGAAASAAWSGGDAAGTRELLDRIDRLGVLEAGVRLDSRYLRALIELRSGVPGDALAILLPLVREAGVVDPGRAGRMLMTASEAAFHAQASESWAEISRLAATLAVRGGSGAGMLARLLAMTYRPVTGGPAQPADLQLEELETMDDPEMMVMAGGMAVAHGDHALGRRLRANALARARMLGAAGIVAWTLQYLALDDIARGQYASSEAHADEGRRLALETNQPNIACLHLALLAEVAALRGRDQEARQLAGETIRDATARSLRGTAVIARRALAQLALARGRPAEALEQLQALLAVGLGRHQGMTLYLLPDLVEATVRAGGPAAAREELNLDIGLVDVVRSSEASAAAARARALLANGEEASRHYLEALHLIDGTERLLDQARTELLYGEFLRRERRRRDARPHLRIALEMFERLGTPIWADRARSELRATGQTARKRDPSTLDQLTPQELQIVQSVSEGASNRDIAARLFISPRTVDYHLRNVFQKVGSARGPNSPVWRLPGKPEDWRFR
jgi:DNA-binding CsgD family transcriptional regulator